MMRRFHLWIIGLCLASLTACQTSSDQTGYIHYQPNSYIAKTPADIQALAHQAQQEFVPRTGTQVSPFNYTFITDFSYGMRFMTQANNRVLAIGHPQKCNFYFGTGGYPTIATGVQDVLHRCMAIAQKNEHTQDCQCRIAMINETLFLTPEEFKFRSTLPAVALVKDTKRGRQEILGYAKTTGRSGEKQPLAFYTSSDQEVCRGHYSVTAYGTNGKAFFSCFNGGIEGPAVFKIAGYHEGQPIGTLLIKAGENEVIMVYGLPTEEYYKRKDALIKGLR